MLNVCNGGTPTVCVQQAHATWLNLLECPPPPHPPPQCPPFMYIAAKRHRHARRIKGVLTAGRGGQYAHRRETAIPLHYLSSFQELRPQLSTERSARRNPNTEQCLRKKRSPLSTFSSRMADESAFSGDGMVDATAARAHARLCPIAGRTASDYPAGLLHAWYHALQYCWIPDTSLGQSINPALGW